jgi:hypothetical protein
LLLLTLLTIPWLKLPYDAMDWVAFSQAYATPTPEPPAGPYSLSARVFIDYRCDQFFQYGLDIPLPSVPVTLSFPDGSSVTHETYLDGLVLFNGFDASEGVIASVELPESYRGHPLRSCFNSPASVEVQPGDFQFKHKHLQFGAERFVSE